MTTTLLKLTALTGLSFSLISCAGTTPSATITDQLEPALLVTSKDTVNIKLTTAPGVELLNYDKSRFTDKLTHRLNRKKSSYPTTRDAKTFSTTVKITEFDKGNAFARSMSAGLGQIKIKSYVTHLDKEGNSGAFFVNKTFAWGGMYGATIKVDDIEDSLINSITKTLTESN